MTTVSVGLSHTYTTLALLSSYLNSKTLTEAEIVEVYNDSGPVAEGNVAVILGGWLGSNGTNTVTMRPASGQGFRDHASVATNPLRWDSAVGAALTSAYQSGGVDGCYRFSGDNFFVDGLQFRTTDTGPSAGISMRVVALSNTILRHAGQGPAVKYTSAGGSLRNAAVIVIANTNNHGISCGNDGGTTVIEGVAVVKLGTAGGTGIQSTNNPVTLKNTAVFGFSSDVTTSGAGTITSSSTHNATDKATWSVTNAGLNGQVSLTSADYVNLTSGSEDLRPASTSTKLINTGATAGLTSDIFGVARPSGAAYDIGPAEHVGGGAPAGPIGARLFTSNLFGPSGFGIRR